MRGSVSGPRCYEPDCTPCAELGVTRVSTMAVFHKRFTSSRGASHPLTSRTLSMSESDGFAVAANYLLAFSPLGLNMTRGAALLCLRRDALTRRLHQPRSRERRAIRIRAVSTRQRPCRARSPRRAHLASQSGTVPRNGRDWNEPPNAGRVATWLTCEMTQGRRPARRSQINVPGEHCGNRMAPPDSN
jgi:hypothetical protein